MAGFLQINDNNPGDTVGLLRADRSVEYLSVATAAAGGVSSWNSRTGDVLPQTGDYAAGQVGNDSLAPGTSVAAALTNVRDIPSIDLATTGNVALTGTPANLDAGFAPVSGVSTIFVWLQTDPKENGVYLYNSAGAWTRAPNWTTGAAFRPGQPFQIANGTLYGGRTAYLKNAAQPTLGVTSIIFNVDLQIIAPTQLGQSLFYDPATNQLNPYGIKSALLADADATVGVGASEYILQTQLTANRTVTLDNAGAITPWTITFSLRVVLAFTLQINNDLGALFTFPAGRKWYGAFQFSASRFGGPTGLQEGV